jgi:site-specific DNA recombinase
VLAALYARVSSEQQVLTGTIQSQLAAVRAYVAQRGVVIPPEREFVDDGYSGATLIRPALERLRDLAAAGGLEHLYVLAPDRLARKYAYQVLLLEEFARAGVHVIFLTHPLPTTPTEELLLQVQGMLAEYERAQLAERSRRGKRHAAQSGRISILTNAPYGYRYVRKPTREGEARYEVVPDEARVVQQMFAWVAEERLSIAAVGRRLEAASIRTRKGRAVWDRSVIWGMLRNPAYIGRAAWGKTRLGPWQAPLRAGHGRQVPPRRVASVGAVPPDEWIAIPVPAIVDEAVFAAVQEQLAENQQRLRANPHGVRYLLQGLLVCGCCGYAFYGRTQPTTRRELVYYRCSGSDAHRWHGTRICTNSELRADGLDAIVWEHVRGILEEPERLRAEYQRRMSAPAPVLPPEEIQLNSQRQQLRQGLERLIDSYAEGLIAKEEFEPRVRRLRERLGHLEEQVQQQQAQQQRQQELEAVLASWEDFARQVRAGLEEVDWATRRSIIRAVVGRIEVGPDQVSVVFRVGPGPPTLRVSSDLHYCTWRELAGAFHDHMGNAQVGEPVGQGEQAGRHGAEGAHGAHDLAGRGRSEGGGGEGLLVDIQAGTMGKG